MIPTFLYTLASGMMLVLATGRTDQIAWRFLRLAGVIVLTILCGTLAWSVARPDVAPGPTGRWTMALALVAASGAAAVLLVAPLASRIPTVFRTICLVSGLAALLAGEIAVIAQLGSESIGALAVVMTVVAQAFAAALLGSITVAWLLGHAYLTATKMTIAPLRHFSRLLSWAVALRIGIVLISVLVAWLLGGQSPTPVLAQLAQGWIVLMLRVGVGLVCVGVFAYMVSDCVRLRSTQSATGILYFASLCAYVGELANLHLLAQYGWPL